MMPRRGLTGPRFQSVGSAAHLCRSVPLATHRASFVSIAGVHDGLGQKGLLDAARGVAMHS
jgi:hypothetical protein